MTRHHPDDQPNPLELYDPARLGLPRGPVDDAAMIADALGTLTGRCNLLAPLTRLDSIPPMHSVSLRCVVFDFDNGWYDADGNNRKSNGIWYVVEGNRYALHGTALQQLSAAAGIQIRTQRMDDHTMRYVWHYKAIGTIKDFDGRTRVLEAERVVDLRDGTPEAEALLGTNPKRPRTKALANARKFGPMNAESKAKNRVIRQLLGLKGGYEKWEAAQPFVFPVLVFQPDMDDPEIRKLVTAAELGVVAEVYGAPSQPVEGSAYRPAGGEIEVTAEPTPPATSTPRERPAGWGGQPAQPAQEARRLAAPRQTMDEAMDGWQPDAEEAEAIRRQEAREYEQEQRAALHDQCSECGTGVSDSVADFSRRKYDRVLCLNHQPHRGGRR